MLDKLGLTEQATKQEIKNAIRTGTIEMRLMPVLCGSAFRNKGINPVLDAIVDFMPSPAEVPKPKEITDDKLAGMIFKVQKDLRAILCSVRLFGGSIKVGDTIFNATQNISEKVKSIFKETPVRRRREEVEELFAGEVGTITGFAHAKAGDTICDSGNPILLDTAHFQESEPEFSNMEQYSKYYDQKNIERWKKVYKFNPDKYATEYPALRKALMTLYTFHEYFLKQPTRRYANYLLKWAKEVSDLVVGKDHKDAKPIERYMGVLVAALSTEASLARIMREDEKAGMQCRREYNQHIVTFGQVKQLYSANGPEMSDHLKELAKYGALVVASVPRPNGKELKFQQLHKNFDLASASDFVLVGQGGEDDFLPDGLRRGREILTVKQIMKRHPDVVFNRIEKDGTQTKLESADVPN
jgi:hypothetical protein